MKALIAAVLVLSGCWGHSFPGWDATPKAGFERMQGAHTTACVQGNPCQLVSQCFTEARARCVDAGYPETCGYSEPEGTCGVGVR